MTRPVSEILEELDAALSKATARPWSYAIEPNGDEYAITAPGDWFVAVLMGSPGDAPNGDNAETKANAALIVALVNAYPVLRAELQRLRGALEFYADKKNYKVRKKSGFARNKPSGHYTKTISPQTMFDKGRLARRTLKGDEDNGGQ